METYFELVSATQFMLRCCVASTFLKLELVN